LYNTEVSENPTCCTPKLSRSFPLLNELMCILGSLGETHELHPPSGSQPGIVVHVCEESAGTSQGGTPQPKARIAQTRCPDHHN